MTQNPLVQSTLLINTTGFLRTNYRKASISRPLTAPLAVADGGTTPKVHNGWMWDLTVPGNNDHDFYVLSVQTGSRRTNYVTAGGTPILVHNSNDPTCGVGSDALQQTFESANTEAKLGHVIDPAKHGSGNLVQAAGGRSEAMKMIVDSLGDAADLPQAGRFEVVRTIIGEQVTIRGAMVNGIPRLGTAFIRSAFPGSAP